MQKGKKHYGNLWKYIVASKSVNISKTNLVYHIFTVFTRGKSKYRNYYGKMKKTLLFLKGVL